MRFNILLLFLLTSGWICYGYDAGVSPGGEKEQDPNNPKYQKMAEELARTYLHIKAKNIKKVTVHKVTTQEVEGTITKIQFQIFLINGKSPICNSKIWEKEWEKQKFVTFECESPLFSKKQLSNRVNSRPGQERDPKNPKYQKLASLSISDFFAMPGERPFKKEDVKKITVSRAKVKVDSKIMTVLTFDVITVNNDRYKCKSVVVETPWENIDSTKVTDIDCDITTGKKPDETQLPELGPPQEEKPGKTQPPELEPPQDEKPDETQLPELEPPQEEKPDETQLSELGPPQEEKSEPGEPGENEPDIDSQTLPQNINDPMVIKEVQTSAAKYLREKYRNIIIKRFNMMSVNNIATKAGRAKITYINFNVTSSVRTKTSIFICTSVYETLKNTLKHISLNCYEDQGKKIGGLKWTDPSERKYVGMAEQAFEKYWKNRSPYGKKDTIVTFVTYGVTKGYAYKINFIVRPLGLALRTLPPVPEMDCHSDILVFRKTIVKSVSCKNKDSEGLDEIEKEKESDGEEGVPLGQSNENEVGGQELQNPNDDKYIRLAKESFERYRKSHNRLKIPIKKFKIDKVTTQVVAGTIIRIDFHVESHEGQIIPCKSQIWEKVDDKYDFNVTCQLNEVNLGGEQQQDPQDPKYQRLAKESFEKYREKHRSRFSSVSVKKFIVTRVTTQVVAGLITRLDFNAILTTGKQILDFQSIQCHSEILERPRQKRKTINVKCEPLPNKMLSGTGPIYGGEMNQDPGDPKYKRLAEESFKKYRRSHNLREFTLKELRVTKATSQVVSGVIIRIDFKAIPTKGNALQCHSEILEQPWLKNKNIEVKCVPFLNKKLSGTSQIDGGEMNQDPGDPKYKRLAEESLKKYRMAHNLRLFTLKELRVTKATSQVVSGVIIRIDFKAIPTKGNALQCHSEILEQPWLKNKNIEVKCVPFLNKKLSGTSQIYGGEMNQDPSDPKYKRFAEESFKKYRTSHNLREFTLKELRVTKATSQVVSGVIIRIDFKAIPTKGKALQCHSEILEQPWLKNKNIEVKCVPFLNKKLSGTSQIYGGEMNQDPSDPKYKQFAEESLKQYRTSHNLREFTLKELRVTKATSQVVSGVIIRIDFKAIPTKGNALQCHSEILEQPWLKNKNIEVKCVPFLNKKLSGTSQIDGGEMNQDPSDPKYKRFAEESLKKYRTSHNLREFTLKELRVTKATSQVVSGVIIRIDFKAIPTKGNALQCHSEILEQPWLKNKNIEVKCVPFLNKKLSGTSQIYGGEMNQDSSDPKYKRFAEESFKKYRTSHNLREFTLKELRVTKATSQVVSGVIIRIDFKAIPTKGNALQCHSEILEQPWLKNKNIKVNCQSVLLN
ncbi:uncharacterized protein LOC134799083 isoform X1 [Cydia splendana]|uniref:uncharacterized protein LOC134799083 isoform X1 n=1 Tax=Cydia splendana TaxID=1100963 RepID=UPI00300C2192